MGLREELQASIKKKRISVAKLARLADINQDTIYNFLRGNSQMTAVNLDKLFEVLRAK
jgi:transcriptional regulator with XRE-family HTH domain